MKVRLLTVGKTRSSYLKSGIEDYLERLSHYCSVDWIEIPSESVPAKAGSAQIEQLLQKEARKIGEKIPTSSAAIALALTGKQFTSEKMAELLSGYERSGKQAISFVVGGAHGLHESVLKKAALCLSLSEMTLPHELAALVLVEQLYRAKTILRGEPYHK